MKLPQLITFIKTITFCKTRFLAFYALKKVMNHTCIFITELNRTLN